MTTLFELIDKDGAVVASGPSLPLLAEIAQRAWPDEDQDPERVGNGWDIQTVGAK